MTTQQVSHDFEDHEVEVALDSGEVLQLYVDFTVEAKLHYEPEQISGPPERCHPGTAEVDILKITITSAVDAEGQNYPITHTLASRIDDQLDRDYLYEALWEEWQTKDELAADGPEPDED